MKLIREILERVIGIDDDSVADVTSEEIVAFLKHKFGDNVVLSDYRILGNIIKMNFVVGGNAGVYETDKRWINKNIVFKNY